MYGCSAPSVWLYGRSADVVTLTLTLTPDLGALTSAPPQPGASPLQLPPHKTLSDTESTVSGASRHHLCGYLCGFPCNRHFSVASPSAICLWKDHFAQQSRQAVQRATVKLAGQVLNDRQLICGLYRAARRLNILGIHTEPRSPLHLNLAQMSLALQFS
ncbi:hypothetical protein J6590_019807 [Homalodisca vitripennis]|nr:hypothetical protein J6590_019807 [Homalodisca vitripennis]